MEEAIKIFEDFNRIICIDTYYRLCPVYSYSFVFCGQAARAQCTRPANAFKTFYKEDQATGLILWTYKGFDSDGDAIIFYSIGSIAPFRLSLDGTLRLNDPLDFESADKHILDNIYVRDHNTSASNGDRCKTIAIFVRPVNEFVPEFDPHYQTVSIPEDSRQDTIVAGLICTDQDKEPSGLPDGCSTVAILSGDDSNPKFKLNAALNEIQTTANVIDYDTGDVTYTLIVIGVDSSVPEPRKTGTTTITVNILPVNEFTPQIMDQPLTLTIREDTPVGTEVLAVNTTDDDGGHHGEVTYTIIVQNGNSTMFYIENTTGKIFLAQKLDFETIPQYKIIVLATDGGGLTDTGTITINVENANDHAPTCVTSVESFNLSESVELGYVLMADFGCSDLDNDPLTYALTQVPTDNTFEVDNVSNQFRVKGALDYERSSFYSITIIVSDGSSSTRLKIAVNILNENEDAPQFLHSVINAFVSEADTKGKFVAIVSALDTDSDPVTYSFAGVYPNFRIDSKTGKILLRTSIDRETVPTIDLYVIASDGQRSATATVSVTVEDVNETPIFVNSNYKFTVAENTITGTDIGTVQAIDADVGPANGQVRYKILFGNDKSYFQIDNTTGQITVATPVDYEDLQTALLVIEASDMGSPTLSGVCIVSIQILDSNDNTPQYIVPLVVSIAVLMVAFIMAVIFIYLVWRRRRCRKKQKKDDAKKPRVQLTETKQEGHNIPLFEKRGQSQVSTKPTSGWDESNSAVSVVSPVPQKSNEEPIREPDIELENSDKTITLQLPGSYINVSFTEIPPFDTTSKDGSSANDVGNGVEGPELQVKIPVRRGIEIVTGFVYEEDPQTKVRNWIHKPIGENSASCLPYNN